MIDSTPGPDTISSSLEDARAAIRRGDWNGAARSARRSLEGGETAEARELLGLAAWWLSDPDTVFESRERAYRLYLDRHDARRAAQVAIWLDWDYRAFRGEAAVANGWLRRARRLLEADRECAEYGWLLLRESDARIGVDALAAAAGAREAVALGRRYRDLDLEHVGLSLEGLALVAAGEVPRGMQMLDEATAAVVAGDFTDPSAAGVTCCHLISACELVRDFDRAGQWCERVREYCRRWDHPPLFAVCRTQYAGVLVWNGDWAAAERELMAAVAELSELRPGWTALGNVGLAELRRRQGRLDEAVELFERIIATGHPRFSWLDPVVTQSRLGLAALALDRCNPAEAERLGRAVLRHLARGNHTSRAAALEVIVLAAAAGGKERSEAARPELQELEQLAAGVESDAIRASARLAAGATHASQGELALARTALEDAAAGFERAGTPYDALRARLMLAEGLQTEGSLQAAASEAGVVAGRARRLGAAALEGRAHALSRSLRTRPTSRALLTSREREVLTLLAHGLTNRQIAGRLGVSQHTAHRHLGNIYTKLGLSSRAAAVAYAFRQGLA